MGKWKISVCKCWKCFQFPVTKSITPPKKSLSVGVQRRSSLPIALLDGNFHSAMSIAFIWKPHNFLLTFRTIIWMSHSRPQFLEDKSRSSFWNIDKAASEIREPANASVKLVAVCPVSLPYPFEPRSNAEGHLSHINHSIIR